MLFLLRELAVDDGNAVELRHFFGVDIGDSLFTICEDDIDLARRLVDMFDYAVAIGDCDSVADVEDARGGSRCRR